MFCSSPKFRCSAVFPVWDKHFSDNHESSREVVVINKTIFTDEDII